MPENNRRGRVRERLAYMFGYALIGEVAAIIIGKFVGVEVASTEVLMLGGFMMMILIFYFVGEYSREKPGS